MASGKSHIGRLLAERSDRWFIDTDDLIETMTGKSVSTIFEESGEGQFRLLEMRLSRWLQEHVSGAVIATGGGMPLVCNNLRGIGEVLWLDASFEAITDRLKNPDEMARRPLAGDLEALRRRYEERKEIYDRTAHRQISADGPANQVIERIGL